MRPRGYIASYGCANLMLEIGYTYDDDEITVLHFFEFNRWRSDIFPGQLEHEHFFVEAAKLAGFGTVSAAEAAERFGREAIAAYHACCFPQWDSRCVHNRSEEGTL